MALTAHLGYAAWAAFRAWSSFSFSAEGACAEDACADEACAAVRVVHRATVLSRTLKDTMFAPVRARLTLKRGRYWKPSSQAVYDEKEELDEYVRDKGPLVLVRLLPSLWQSCLVRRGPWYSSFLLTQFQEVEIPRFVSDASISWAVMLK